MEQVPTLKRDHDAHSMARLVIFALVASAIVAMNTPSFAGPARYGEALHDAAEAGQITPRGVWDSK